MKRWIVPAFNILTLTSLCLLVGCNLQQSSSSQMMALQASRIILSSYTDKIAYLNIQGFYQKGEILEQSEIQIFTSETCEGNPVGSGFGKDFSDPGIDIEIPVSDVTTIYAKSTTMKTCLFLGQFKFQPGTPLPPIFSMTIPGSPSRGSYQPAVMGSALPHSKVYLFKDSNCNQLVGQGSSEDFKNVGIGTTLSPNATVSIYGKVQDALGTFSNCGLLTSYKHSDMGPSAPVFSSTVPASPNNISVKPKIKGTVGADAINIGIFKDPGCSHLLAEGSVDEFTSTGIEINAIENSLMTLYGKSIDADGNPSYCAFLTNYLFDTVKPSAPIFASVAPPSPTRLTVYPKITGYASQDTVSIRFYNSMLCLNSIGAGSKLEFEGNGIAAGVGANMTTAVYAAAVDQAGNLSQCVSMVDYRHNTIPPFDPTFDRTEPVSPNNQSYMPKVFGVAADGTVSLSFYSDDQCSVLIGSGTPEDFFSEGITVSTENIPDAVNNTVIYVQPTDQEGNIGNCSVLTTYAYSTAKAPMPTFLQTIPISPSNSSLSPFILGTAPKSVSVVKLFKDSLCSFQLGTGSRAVFASQGIRINVSRNSATDIYAISYDIFGNESDCTYFSRYIHDDIQPSPPSFVSSLPLSPNNQSVEPLIKGTAVEYNPGKVLPTKKVALFDSAMCFNRLGEGTLQEFTNQGVQAFVGGNLTTNLYAQTKDEAGNVSTCIFLADYTHDTNPPGDPLVDSLLPLSPSFSRNVTFKGTLSPNQDIVAPLSVSFYRDAQCSNLLGIGNVGKFLGSGILLQVDLNTTTNIYAQTKDIVGNLSNCKYVVDYFHSNVGPTNLLAQQNADGSVGLKWDANITASPTADYVIKRSSVSGGPYAVLSWAHKGAQFTDLSVKNGQTYYYVVASTNTTGISSNSNEVSITTQVNPSVAAYSLSALPGSNSVDLQWYGDVTDMYYNLHRATQPGGPYTVVAEKLTDTTYTDKTVSNGISYYYVVTALNPDVTSAYSNEASATPMSAPSAPTNLRFELVYNANCTGSVGVQLTWSESSYFNSFQINRGVSSGGESTIDSTSTNTYLDCPYSISSGQNLYYTVKGIWGNANKPVLSSPSNEIVIFNQAANALTVVNGNNEVYVTWSPVSLADDYQVWRSTKPGWKNDAYILLDGHFTGTNYHDTSVINGQGYFYFVIPNNLGAPGWGSGEVSATPNANPAAPSNLRIVKDLSAGISTLHWTPSDHYNSFDIYFSSSVSGPFNYSGSSQTNSFVLPTLNGINYFYVVSRWGSFTSAPSNVVSVSSGIPMNVKVTKSSTSISLTWNSVVNAISYNILRASVSGGPYTSIASTSNLNYSNSKTIPAAYPVQDATGYYYVVQPVFSGGFVGGYSAEVAGMLATSNVVNGLTVIKTTSSSIKLKWVPVSNATGYIVYKSSTLNGTYTSISSTSANTTNFDVSPLSSFTKYYFKVAEKSCGLSCVSSAVFGWTYGDPPAPAVIPGDNLVTVTWTGVPGATSYDLYRGTDGANFSMIKVGASGGTFDDTSVANGNLYFYKIIANFPSDSRFSSASSAVTPGLVPYAPSALVVSRVLANDSVSLDWAEVSSISDYTVYLSSTPTGPWVLNTVASGNSAVLGGLTAGQVYYAATKSRIGSRESGLSNVVSFVPMDPPPAPLVKMNGNNIEVTWGVVSGVSTYDVIRYESQAPVTIAAGVSTTSYMDSSVVAGHTYQYSIVSWDSNHNFMGESSLSSMVSTVKPVKPSAIMVRADLSNSVKVSWVPSVSPQVQSYNLYRSSVSGGSYSLIGNVLASAITEYTDLTGNDGANNFYVVTAINNYNGESDYSDEAAINLVSGSVSLNAVMGLSGVDLNWASVSNATGYYILRGQKSGGPYGVIGSTTALNFTDLDIVDSVTYYYRVEAKFANNAISLMSPEASVTGVKKINLQVPIELTDKALSSDTLPLTFARTQTSLEPSAYDGNVSFAFETVASNFDSSDAVVSLLDSGGVERSSIVVPGNTSIPKRFRVSFSPHVVADIYRLKLSGTNSSDALKVYSARILVNQTGASKTKIYIPLLSSPEMPSLGDTFSPIESKNTVGYSVLNYSTVYQRDPSKLSRLVDFNAWEFETVVSSYGGTGLIALYNANSSSIVKNTEIEFSKEQPSLVSAPFSDGVENFSSPGNDLNLYKVAMQCEFECEKGSVNVYKAGLWVSLEKVKKAEVFFRTSPAINFSILPTNVDFERTLVDLSLFSNPVVNFQAYVNGSSAGTLEVQLMSAGSGAGSDEGVASLNGVVGALLSTSSDGLQLLQTSSPITINSEDRIITNINSTGSMTSLKDARISIQISN